MQGQGQGQCPQAINATEPALLENNMPLRDIKVIDLTRARSGPTAVRQLADWGADVIKIERPPSQGPESLGGNRDGFDFQNLHRNKRNLTLDLKSEQGRDIFMKLSAEADVIIENFRPGVKHRLGIDYESVAAINPRIVYGSISGFGQEGPYSNRPGLDQIAQGLSGFMSVTGLPGQGPVRAGIPIADLCGGFNLALGVMIALFERERSGRGQWVHTSLLEALLTMMDFQAARHLMNGEVPGQAGNNHPTNLPAGVFETSDGSVNIQASADHLYARLCEALGCTELVTDERFVTGDDRLERRDELNEILLGYTRTWSSSDLIDKLAEIGVPCGPIHDMGQTWTDPQVKTLDMDPQFDHPRLGSLKLLGQAINMSRTPETRATATADAGEHNDEILAQIGFDPDAIAQLRSDGVV